MTDLDVDCRFLPPADSDQGYPTIWRLQRRCAGRPALGHSSRRIWNGIRAGSVKETTRGLPARLANMILPYKNQRTNYSPFNVCVIFTIRSREACVLRDCVC